MAGRPRDKVEVGHPLLLDSRGGPPAHLIDGIRDCAIYMIDPTGVIVSWNPGAERIKAMPRTKSSVGISATFIRPMIKPGASLRTRWRAAEATGKFEGEAGASGKLRRYPRVRLLFTSGYAQMPGTTTSNALADVPLLSKPFTRAQLYQQISQSLGRH